MSHENALPRDVVPNALVEPVRRLDLDVIDVRGEGGAFKVLLRDGRTLDFERGDGSWRVTYRRSLFCVAGDAGFAPLSEALQRDRRPA